MTILKTIEPKFWTGGVDNMDIGLAARSSSFSLEASCCGRKNNLKNYSGEYPEGYSLWKAWEVIPSRYINYQQSNNSTLRILSILLSLRRYTVNHEYGWNWVVRIKSIKKKLPWSSRHAEYFYAPCTILLLPSQPSGHLIQTSRPTDNAPPDFSASQGRINEPSSLNIRVVKISQLRRCGSLIATLPSLVSGSAWEPRFSFLKMSAGSRL